MGKRYYDYLDAYKDNIRFQEVITTFDDPTPAFALVGRRTIAISNIHNKITYFQALHEIGHVLFDEKESGETNQVIAAFNLKKVTRYILKCEYRASVFAIRTNKFATNAYFQRLASFNQYSYMEKYESDWKTKLQLQDSFQSETQSPT